MTHPQIGDGIEAELQQVLADVRRLVAERDNLRTVLQGQGEASAGLLNRLVDVTRERDAMSARIRALALQLKRPTVTVSGKQPQLPGKASGCDGGARLITERVSQCVTNICEAVGAKRGGVVADYIADEIQECLEVELDEAMPEKAERRG